MKKVFLLLLIFGLIPLVVSSLPESSLFQVVEDKINIRTDSTTAASSLGILSKGEEVEAIEEKFKWYRIILPKRFSCYISKDYLKTIAIKRVRVTGDRVNLRTEPNLESEVIGLVPKNAEFYLISETKTWARIIPYPYARGWVHMDFLKEIKLVPKETKPEKEAETNPATESKVEDKKPETEGKDLKESEVKNKDSGDDSKSSESEDAKPKKKKKWLFLSF